MKFNIGTIDRTARVGTAIAIGMLWYFGHISGFVAIVLCIVAAVFLITSIIGFCPVYLPFNFNTKKGA